MEDKRVTYNYYRQLGFNKKIDIIQASKADIIQLINTLNLWLDKQNEDE